MTDPLVTAMQDVATLAPITGRAIINLFLAAIIISASLAFIAALAAMRHNDRNHGRRR